MSTALPRSKVKQDQTWNAESVFDSPDAFEAEAQSILKSLPAIKRFQGHLADDPVDMTRTKPIEDAFAVLADYIDRLDELTSN
jgi:oligoendopeptidase F